ncbi:hypothetical protein AX16_005437 [Volvariella volvacea WC 439]|nr:hypothetical protein AX16_005437 [Volvariella volvacea WC 439]
MNSGGISAWVEVGGKRLPMYSTQQGEDGITTFSVCLSLDAAGHPTRSELYVDGLLCSAWYCGAPTGIGPPAPVKMGFAEVGPNDMRSSMFSEVQLTDDDTYLDRPIAQEIGEIRLVIHEAELVNVRVEEAGRGQVARRDAPDGVLHERSKKGLGHCTKLGASQPIPRRTVYMSRSVRVIARFIFRYRPVEILRANGIVSLENPNRKRALGEVDLTQVNENEEGRHDAIVQQKAPLLQARLQEPGGSSQSTKRIKVRQKVKREVIDLTLDSD